MTETEEEAAGAAEVAALFEDDDTALAEGFRDKVATLHSYFDRDGDGFLNHSELVSMDGLHSCRLRSLAAHSNMYNDFNGINSEGCRFSRVEKKCTKHNMLWCVRDWAVIRGRA